MWLQVETQGCSAFSRGVCGQVKPNTGADAKTNISDTVAIYRYNAQHRAEGWSSLDRPERSPYAGAMCSIGYRHSGERRPGSSCRFGFRLPGRQTHLARKDKQLGNLEKCFPYFSSSVSKYFPVCWAVTAVLPLPSTSKTAAIRCTLPEYPHKFRQNFRCTTGQQWTFPPSL